MEEGGDESVLLTKEYIRKVVEDMGEDEDFNGDMKNYLKNGKLEQVVVMIKSHTSNALGDKISGTIHYKVLNEGGYEKNITLGATSILQNVGMLDEEEIIKMLEEEEISELELLVGRNVDQEEHQLRYNEETLILTLEEETMEARAEQEWQDKCRQEQ
ncbi:hypothetical protein Tco_1368433 [Tanacetum coccineum]